MNTEDVILGIARGMAIFLFWGLVYVLFEFELTLIAILIYSLIVKRKQVYEDS
tara:strand:+ start:360 stop:518 length:159 start_codon:yes stop_codon:yes gene_type:complete